MNPRATLSGCLLILPALLPVRADDGDSDPQTGRVPRVSIGADPVQVTELEQIIRRSVVRLGRVEGYGTNDDVSARGASAHVYPSVAPAVVIVQTPFGHGTGFFIREEGWLLTNRHVVRDADCRADAGGQVVQINIGLLDDDGWMRVVDEPLRGLVYKTDVRRDLALVKLLDMPTGMDAVPFLEFAAGPPGPGSDCIAIGHPAAGTLWTMRTGELAGSGEFPRDQMHQIIHLLGISSGQDRSLFEEAMLGAPERKQVFLSTCGLNPGDSGGPLVNSEGKVVAVSYAVPTLNAEGDIDLGKFSFHIHFNEVREFLQDWPEELELDAPDPLPVALYTDVFDLDQDGYYDTLMMWEDPNLPAVGALYDLNRDSFGGMSIKQLEQSGEYLILEDFDFEFCVSEYPRVRISYDTDNDGVLDLVFSDEDHDGLTDTQFTLNDGAWGLRPEAGDPVSPKRFVEEELRKRFTALQTIAAIR